MKIFEVANVIIEITIMFFFCGSVFETRKTSAWFKILVAVIVTVLTYLLSILGLGTVVNLTAAFCVCFAVLYFVFKGNIRSKLFISVLYIVALIFADILATIVITFFGIEYNETIENNVTYIVGATLSDFIRLWILVYISKILSKRMQNLPLSYWIFLIMCPILSAACLIIFDIYLMQAEEVNAILIFIPPACILYINFMLFYFFETFSERVRLSTIEELSKKEEENYKILQDTEEDLRGLRHDMNNHILSLDEYLSQGDIKSAENHIRQIKSKLDNISGIVYTSNPSVDAAINIGAKKAKSSGIEYKAHVIGSQNVVLDSADICSFLSNAIDNAIDACLSCDNPYIYIEMSISKEIISIHIENTFHNKPKPDFRTIKSDVKNHGFGMRNMKKVVNKYNGSMNTEYKNNIFCLDAELRNEKI